MPYFANGGYIGCTCPECSTDLKLFLKIYKSGKLIENLPDESKKELINELVEKKIIKIKDEKNKLQSGFAKYILWNMDARYEILECNNCENYFMGIFGMGELQPGREQVQFRGIWQLTKLLLLPSFYLLSVSF